MFCGRGAACLLEAPTLWEESGEPAEECMYLPGRGRVQLRFGPSLVYLALPFFGAPLRVYVFCWWIIMDFVTITKWPSLDSCSYYLIISKKDSPVCGLRASKFLDIIGRYSSAPKSNRLPCSYRLPLLYYVGAYSMNASGNFPEVFNFNRFVDT